MDRPHDAALTDQEIEAFQNAFDLIPPSYAIQPRLSLYALVKSGLFVVAFHLLSFGTIEPNDPPLVMTLVMRDDTPSWKAFDKFPLTIEPDINWPIPDLTLPPLALKALPPRLKQAPSPTEIASFRLNEGSAPRETVSSQTSSTITAAVSPTKPQPQKSQVGSNSPSPRPVNFTTFTSNLSAALKSQGQVLGTFSSRPTTHPSRDPVTPNKGTPSIGTPSIGTPSIGTPSMGTSSIGGFLGGLTKG